MAPIRDIRVIIPIVFIAVIVVSWTLLTDSSGSHTNERSAIVTETKQLQVLSNVPATANDKRAARAQNSPTIAVNPTVDGVLALSYRIDAPDFDCGLAVSNDGGRSWLPANPIPSLPSEVEKCYAPKVGYDSDGTLYYAFVGLAGLGNRPTGTFLVVSRDSGRTFTDAQRILGPGNYGMQMKIASPTRDGSPRLYFAWIHAGENVQSGGFGSPPNPIMAAYTDDQGKTLSEPVQISKSSRRVVAPSIAVGPDKQVYVAYYDLGNDQRDYRGLEGPVSTAHWSIRIASSIDGGATFGKPATVNRSIVPPGRIMLVFTMPPPSLVVDSESSVYVAWTDARKGDRDIFVSRLSRVDTSWGKAVRVNDDDASNDRDQYLPKLAASGSGRVDIAFYDRRNDPMNLRNNVFFSSWYQGEEGFGQSIKMTTKASDSRSGQRYLVPSAAGLVDFGSRLGLVAGPQRSIAAWADTRNSTSPPYQDIFVGEVRYSR